MTVPVGPDGGVDVYNRWGQTDVVVDVVGYYSDATGGGYDVWTTMRALDSRPDSQVGPYDTPWAPGETRTVPLDGHAHLQSTSTAVVLNVTVTDTDAAGYLTVWPTGSPRPLASSLNWAPGQTIANSVTVPLGAGDSVDIYSPFGQVDVVVDVVANFQVGVEICPSTRWPRRGCSTPGPGRRWGPTAPPWATTRPCWSR